jgi:hypothetical protein
MSNVWSFERLERSCMAGSRRSRLNTRKMNCRSTPTLLQCCSIGEHERRNLNWFFLATSRAAIFTRARSSKDYIRPAGCCLVVCPKCSAQVGAWCQDQTGKRVEVHQERWASAGPFSRVGWHTFRHMYRSWLDSTGAPLGVQQKLMRHAQISTTMNVRKCIDGLQARRQ